MPDAIGKATEMIKRFEGLRLNAYQDVVGVWTIGYGSTGPGVRAGLVWTQAQCDADLKARVATLEHVISAMLERPAKDNQMAAFVSFAYNVGLSAFEKSSVRRLFNAGDMQGAADAFRMWIKAGGKVLVALVKRREAERAFFMS